jgi:hypothetical protein
MRKGGSMERGVKLRIPRFRRFTTVQLLVVLGLLFFSFPFVEEVKGGDIIVSVLLSLVLISAVLAVASRRRTLVVAVLLMVPAIAGRWINHFRPDLVPPAVFLVSGLVLVAFVVVNLLGFVLRAPSVNTEVLCASISAYLMLGLMWTMAYWLVDQLTPGGAFSFNTNAGTQSMNGFNAFYFSFITLSTVGYGDITHDRAALCGGPDCPPGFTLFDSEIRRFVKHPTFGNEPTLEQVQ